MLAGSYLLLNYVSPSIPYIDGKPPQATAQKLMTVQPGSEGNRLYIPQLNVDVAVEQGSDAVSALEGNAWHRNPQNGDPVKGGNFALSASRFNFGITPVQTKSLSPFYHIDQLQVGDELFIDWEGKRYVYEISHKSTADQNASDLESDSKESKLTLYSCDSEGEKDGQVAVVAKPTGVVAWNGSNPYLEQN